MPIAEVVDHLYVIRRKQDKVTISFRTSRTGAFFPIFLAVGLCSLPIWMGLHRGWRGEIMSAIVGASVGLVAATYLNQADQLTRYVITVEPESVSFQKEFQGIPVGPRKIYHRALVSDLGMYPQSYLSSPRRPLPLCSLRLWVAGRSIELENLFPIAEGISLAKD